MPAALRRADSARMSGCPEENVEPRPCTQMSAVRRRPRGWAATPSRTTPSRVPTLTRDTGTPVGLGIPAPSPVSSRPSSTHRVSFDLPPRLWQDRRDANRARERDGDRLRQPPPRRRRQRHHRARPHRGGAGGRPLPRHARCPGHRPRGRLPPARPLGRPHPSRLPGLHRRLRGRADRHLRPPPDGRP